MQTTSIQYQCLQHQPNTNAHYINPKSMLIATDFIFFGFPSLKTFILRSMPLTCHSARSRRWSQNPAPKIILSPGRGPSQTVVRSKQKHFLHSSFVWYASFKSFLRLLNSDSATRQALHQNDRRVRREIGTKNQFIKVCSYKRLKMNCICSLSKK